MRRTGARVGAAAAVALAAAGALLAAAEPPVGAVGVVLALCVLVFGAVRLESARRADRREERWLHSVLDPLENRPADGEDEDLLVP